MMEFEQHDSYEALSRQAAAVIYDALLRKPDLLLCAATGATPTRAYQLLAEKYNAAPRAFDFLRVLKLDEWMGLQKGDDGSCERYLQRQLLGPLHVAAERYEGFDAAASDPAAECARIQQWLTAHGPIDLCLLGIGTNGHIALNEPARTLQPRAHVATLARTTRHHPMLAAAPIEPTHGFTLGVAEIMAASHILLLISGGTKRAVLRRLREREITPEFPASLLWQHGKCTVLYDADAD